MIIALFVWNMQGIFRSFNNVDEICGQYRARGDKRLTGNPVSLFISADDTGMGTAWRTDDFGRLPKPIPPKRFGGQSRRLAVECRLTEQDTNDVISDTAIAFVRRLHR